MPYIMKSFLKKNKVLSQFILTIILYGSALILGGMITTPLLREYFPFASVVLLIIATWILYKIDKKSLKDIGLNVSFRNLSFLPLGLLIGAVAFFLVKICRGFFTGETIVFTTSDLNFDIIFFGFYTLLGSVAVEEFLFRGYAFKKTIEVTNVKIANVIFATLFMLIHVLDREILKNYAMVLFFFITIPIGHLLFSTALLKSKTIFFPIGIHLGNNWATQHSITHYNNGNSIFYIPEVVTFETWMPFITVIIVWDLFYLIVIYLIWKWDSFKFLKRRF